MTKRKRLVLGGLAAVILALIPGSAGADTVGGGKDGGGCPDRGGAEAPASFS